jgi:uncharacterized membrane protein
MNVKYVSELVGAGFQLAGIVALVCGTFLALIVYIRILSHRGDASAAYRGFRRNLGKAILLGLELLVAADIIRSVALDPRFATIGVLGMIVVIRTFLSWSLEVEVNEKWPWQRSRASNNAVTNPTGV